MQKSRQRNQGRLTQSLASRAMRVMDTRELGTVTAGLGGTTIGGPYIVPIMRP